MSISNKKAYVYKMNLVPANILGLVVFVLLCLVTYFIVGPFELSISMGWFFLILILYLFLHELLHGIGFSLDGAKRESITYGICLEKGILYCMANQIITRRNILVSLQMPFMVIGVITYLVGIIFHFPVLILLSIFNLMGASMDLVMFFYIIRLPQDVCYSESGKPDEFVLISKDDLTLKKSLFMHIVESKDFHEEDFEFKNLKKFTISKFSIIFFIIFSLLCIINMFL